jgi:Cu(I)/Ag(I) efflux system membrane protein CusA/SilA
LGGMVFEISTVFIVPTLYCWWAERKLKQNSQAFAKPKKPSSHDS